MFFFWVVIVILAIILLAAVVHWAGGGALNLRLGHFAQDLLPAEPVGSVQFSVVEDLGGVPAQVRVHSVRPVEQ